MKAISIEQLYATLKSISRSVFKHISKVQETADKAQKTAAGKMDAVNPTATGYFEMNRPSHATHVPGAGSFSMGSGSATGINSHAEGNSYAEGRNSHAEGSVSTAKGDGSHAEGNGNVATGIYSHAEGSRCEAQGYSSHAEGIFTIAKYEHQHVQGRYNDPGPSQTPSAVAGVYAHIVGNGYVTDKGIVRSNAHTLDWDGNAWYKGDVYVGGTGQEDQNASKLIVQKDIGNGLKMDGDKLTVDEGVYELIDEVTVTEENTKNVLFRNEPNGNDYAFTALLVEIDAEKRNEAAIGYVYFYGERDYSNFVGGVYIPNNMFSTTTRKTTKVICNPFYGLWRTECRGTGQTGDISGASNSVSTIITLDLAQKVSDYPCVRAFRVTVSADGGISVGTKIRVWGVRANA